MDENSYEKLAETTLRRIENAFREIDTDRVDCERAGDVLNLTFAGGQRCVINTQRAVRQLWLAANARGWHFNWDAESGQWMDDKGRGEDLLQMIVRLVREGAAVEIAF